MAKQSINTLKNWFKRGLKPLEAQFADWLDSFWHKDATDIPISSIQNLEDTLNDLATNEAVEAIDAAKEDKVKKGVANGYASLDGAGKVPAAQIPEVHFRGKYISLAALQLALSVANDGDYAIVNAGTGSNAIEYIWDTEEGWIQSSGAGGVTSFNSRSGPVTSQVGDYTTDQVTEGANQYFTNARALAAAPAETVSTVGSLVNSATSKATPVDADQLALMDSAAGNVIKKLSWANVKATLKTYFDTLYQSALGYTAENVANKDIDGTLSANSDVKYPSQKAVKTYADTKQSALGFTPENSANKGAANGYAPLDSSTKIPSAYLPAYVDDVLEYANFAALPATGTSGIIYVTIDTNYEYRWSGSAYIRLVSSPGTTDALAEGTTNLYFTAARVLATVLAGLSTATNAAITNTDSVLTALGKLQKQITDLPASFYTWVWNFATTVTSTTDTIDTARAGKKIRYNSATDVTVTIPLNASDPIPIGSRYVLRQSNTGKVIVSPTGGVTVNTPDATLLSTQKQYSELYLIKSATDTWELLVEASSLLEVKPKLKSTTFTSVVDLDKCYYTTQSITGAIAYTKGSSSHVIGNVREDFLLANGVNKPTFDANHIVVWDNWVNTINTLNVIRFEYLSNGKIQVDLRYIQ